MRRALSISVAVVILVVLSGCNALLAPAHEYPPGVTGGGVRDASALADAHEQHLQRGYRVHVTTTFTAANGTVVQRVETKKRWAASRAYRATTYRKPHPLFGHHVEIFLNESAAFVRTETAGGNVSVRRLDTSQAPVLVQGPGAVWDAVYQMAGARNTTATALANGTTRVRFANAYVGTTTGNGTLSVTPNGLVTRYSLTFERSWRGQRLTVHRTVDVSHVGSPGVEKPDWVANASSD